MPERARRRRELVDLLESLYAQQLKQAPDPYLKAHAGRSSIERQVDVFERYRPFLQDRRALLDWGCDHAPDACLLRHELGEAVELHGCDFPPPGSFAAFHEFARLRYTQLEDRETLPYERERFDAVIASGVLEHVGRVGESLKELHRILVEGGVLVISFLPNWLSPSEWAARRIGATAHRRLFRRYATARLLRHYGFDPVLAAYHQLVPAQRMQAVFRPLWPANALLERTWPLRVLCANLLFVAERRSWM